MKNSIPNRVHFVGIGGIGMSSLAQHLLRRGHAVSGSDRAENEQTAKLRRLGATVVVPHCEQSAANAQLVVRTSAVPLQNEEVQFALANKIPVVLREELLGQIFDEFSTRIAVCGTHGKTTVTAMLHHMLERCGISHAAFIGGEYEGENYFFGKDVVVAEACEYNRSFLQLHPTLCVCENVEFDHPDCYKNFADVEQAFAQLFAQSEKVLLSKSCKRLCENAVVCDEHFFTNNIFFEKGKARFSLSDEEGEAVEVKLGVCGAHNVLNATMALAVAKQLNLPLLQAAQSLSTFHGADRRWTEVAGCCCRVVCDYAHHPTEIQTTVATAKSVCTGRVIALFQPHTYSRTQAFWKEFADCFKGVDEVAYLPVYSAREKPIPGVTSFRLYRAAKAQGLNAKYFASFQSAARHVCRVAAKDDLVVLVGAGSVNTLAQLLKD